VIAEPSMPSPAQTVTGLTGEMVGILDAKLTFNIFNDRFNILQDRPSDTLPP